MRRDVIAELAAQLRARGLDAVDAVATVFLAVKGCLSDAPDVQGLSEHG